MQKRNWQNQTKKEERNKSCRLDREESVDQNGGHGEERVTYFIKNCKNNGGNEDDFFYLRKEISLIV